MSDGLWTMWVYYATGSTYTLWLRYLGSMKASLIRARYNHLV